MGVHYFFSDPIRRRFGSMIGLRQRSIKPTPSNHLIPEILDQHRRKSEGDRSISVDISRLIAIDFLAGARRIIFLSRGHQARFCTLTFIDHGARRMGFCEHYEWRFLEEKGTGGTLQIKQSRKAIAFQMSQMWQQICFREMSARRRCQFYRKHAKYSSLAWLDFC
uniref:Uncharacterized protein LOC105055702 n=1 Tax=Elaeis guineensis var. tenera TaxID=51953 RepID=A0A8N4IIT0_ELAGV|nr:uncharacterized protein LOC105055702 [Elaeis guineensis]